MINQLTVLILLTAILYAGTSLRYLAVAGDGCKDCDCGNDCNDKKEKK